MPSVEKKPSERDLEIARLKVKLALSRLDLRLLVRCAASWLDTLRKAQSTWRRSSQVLPTVVPCGIGLGCGPANL